jgi:uncharacterized cupin superfamily protein
MRRFNLHADEPAYDADEPAGFHIGATRISADLGPSDLVVKLYEVPVDESVCPYHYEHGCDEWLVVLSGRVRVRHPAGEDELDGGDVVRFPDGPAGAHRVTGASAEPARVLMFSRAFEPAVSVYPDSDKIGVWTAGRTDDVMLHRRDGAVDYWEGER